MNNKFTSITNSDSEDTNNQNHLKVKLPHEIELKGSYHDMGKMMGKVLKKNNYRYEEITYANKERIEMADKNEKLVEQYMPGMLDMLKGMDSEGFDYYQLRIVPLVISYGEPTQSCTMLYVPSGFTKSNSAPMIIESILLLQILVLMKKSSTVFIKR